MSGPVGCCGQGAEKARAGGGAMGERRPSRPPPAPLPSEPKPPQGTPKPRRGVPAPPTGVELPRGVLAPVCQLPLVGVGVGLRPQPPCGTVAANGKKGGGTLGEPSPGTATTAACGIGAGPRLGGCSPMGGCKPGCGIGGAAGAPQPPSEKKAGGATCRVTLAARASMNRPGVCTRDDAGCGVADRTTAGPPAMSALPAEGVGPPARSALPAEGCRMTRRGAWE